MKADIDSGQGSLDRPDAALHAGQGVLTAVRIGERQDRRRPSEGRSPRDAGDVGHRMAVGVDPTGQHVAAAGVDDGGPSAARSCPARRNKGGDLAVLDDHVGTPEPGRGHDRAAGDCLDDHRPATIYRVAE